MKAKIQVTKLHTIELDDDELDALVSMLIQLDKDFYQKLPEGYNPDREQREIFANLYYMKHGTVYRRDFTHYALTLEEGND